MKIQASRLLAIGFMFSENKRKHSTDLCEDVSTIEDRKEDIAMAL